jgi:hypothetical protein
LLEDTRELLKVAVVACGFDQRVQVIRRADLQVRLYVP